MRIVTYSIPSTEKIGLSFTTYLGELITLKPGSSTSLIDEKDGYAGWTNEDIKKYYESAYASFGLVVKAEGKEEPKGERSYKNLIDKPAINGTTLYENYNEEDPTVPGWAKNEVKPSYSYTEVGAVGAENELNFTEIDNMFNLVFGR